MGSGNEKWVGDEEMGLKMGVYTGLVRIDEG